MLLLTGTTHKYRLITSQAGDVDFVGSFADESTADPPVMKGSTPTPFFGTITTATTTDVIAGAASTVRAISNITVRNTHASVTNDVTLILDVSGTIYEIVKFTLLPGEGFYYEDGLGYFKFSSTTTTPVTLPPAGSTNFMSTATAAGFASDTYIAESKLTLAALGAPRVGRMYKWRLIISKTNVGTAAPVLIVRVGTNGSTADTARLTFTWGAGTAAADRGEIELEAKFTAVGASAVLRAKANWTTNLATTGLTNAVKALQVTSGTFDSGVAGSFIGLSYNGGATAAHTVEDLNADTVDL